MASNEVEVVDPSVAIEKTSRIASGVAINRRHFMAALGVAGAVGTGLVPTRSAVAQQPTHNGYSQVDVINFLLNLKYLKATFYAGVLTGKDIDPSFGVTNGGGGVYNLPTKVTFTGSNAAQITDLFNEMYYDEIQQLIALRAMQGNAVAARATINLAGDSPVDVSFKAPSATATLAPGDAIAMAQYLEDLSFTAFAGASIYLTGANLQYIAQILATDAFHSGAIRLISLQNGSPYDFHGTANFNFTAAGIAGSNILYGFVDPANPVAVNYALTTSDTIAITGDKNSNGGSGSIAYKGAASDPGLSSLTTVTAVSAIPSSYDSGYKTASSSHHLNLLTDVPAAIAQTWAPGMPVYDSGKYFPNPGTYIVSITPNSSGGTYSVEMSASSGGHTPGEIFVGTTAMTLDDPLTSSGAVTASTIGVITGDPRNVLPKDIGPGVATTGPTLNPKGVPKSALNQGFFDTAGNGNSSAPAGLGFTRSFGQVLAKLYGADSDSSGNPTYEGGFYPLGVSGTINVVS